MREARTVLITGADGGIGAATTRALAAQGLRVLMASRDPERAERVRKDMQAELVGAELEVLSLDLASHASIRALARELLARAERIDVLINNAGVYCRERSETVEGFERTLGVNYLGPVLLSCALLPCLERSPAARIINLGSNAHRRGVLRLEDLHWRSHDYHPFKAYAGSKIAIVLGTRALARRLAARGITVNAVHPGHASTNIWPREGMGWKLVRPLLDRFLISAQAGAEPSVRLAISESATGVSGSYFDRFTVAQPGATARDDVVGELLWAETCALLAISPETLLARDA